VGSTTNAIIMIMPQNPVEARPRKARSAVTARPTHVPAGTLRRRVRCRESCTDKMVLSSSEFFSVSGVPGARQTPRSGAALRSLIEDQALEGSGVDP